MTDYFEAFSETHLHLPTEKLKEHENFTEIVNKLNSLSFKIENNLLEPKQTTWYFNSFPKALQAISFITFQKINYEWWDSETIAPIIIYYYE